MVTFLGNGRTNKLYEDIIFKYRKSPDVIISCQYPYKIPLSIIRSAPCVNVHYGLLPHFRGTAPIYWQMINSNEAGVTLHYVDENFDTGDIIDTYSFPHYGKTANEVYDELEGRGLELVGAWIDKIIDGTAPRIKQGEGIYYKSPDWKEVVKCDVLFTKMGWRRAFATHFEGKQYPEIEINGRTFELRAK